MYVKIHMQNHEIFLYVSENKFGCNKVLEKNDKDWITQMWNYMKVCCYVRDFELHAKDNGKSLKKSYMIKNSYQKYCSEYGYWREGGKLLEAGRLARKILK